MKHEHTPETLHSIYQYCKCGATRHRDSSEWHICPRCATGAPCRIVSRKECLMDAMLVLLTITKEHFGFPLKDGKAGLAYLNRVNAHLLEEYKTTQN